MEGKDYRSVFSNRLNYYMDLRGKQQSDLCKDLGLPTSSVSAWCTGLKLPRPETLDIIAEYLGATRTDLLEYPKGGDEELINNDGRKILKIYNNNSSIKVLFDNIAELSEEKAQILIDMSEQLKRLH